VNFSRSLAGQAPKGLRYAGEPVYKSLSGSGRGREYWGRFVAYYRLYFMDGLSGHVAAVRDLHAANDEAAIAQAERHRRAVAMELWCKDRKVKRWAPEPA